MATSVRGIDPTVGGTGERNDAIESRIATMPTRKSNVPGSGHAVANESRNRIATDDHSFRIRTDHRNNVQRRDECTPGRNFAVAVVVFRNPGSIGPGTVRMDHVSNLAARDRRRARTGGGGVDPGPGRSDVVSESIANPNRSE